MRVRQLAPLLVAGSLLAAACGGSGNGSDDDGDDAADGNGEGSAELNAAVASYDLAAQSDERFMVGLIANDNRLLAFGSVTLSFGFAGTPDEPIEQVEVGSPVEATYLPIAGQDLDPDQPGPRLVSPADARGVYAVPAVRFDRAGLWAVQAEGSAEDVGDFQVQTVVEVKAEHQVVAVGQPGPPTQNPLPGESELPATAIDSRASDGTVPDPDLHSTTVAAALDAGRPVVVLVSTPVYCVSRFCGPITDAVANMAQEFGDRVDFVHLEVWQDFEDQIVNEAAQEWITPADGSEAQEPWVFLVDSNGMVVERFDNVVSDAELRQAVEALAV
jgi:hypothetical protein